MDVRQMLWDAARSEKKRGLPILSFPAVQKLGVTVEQLVKDPELQVQAMATIARETDTLAAVSLMDLSLEAEAFGAEVRFSAHEIPAVVGQLVSDEEEAESLEIPGLDQGRISVFTEGSRLAKQRITDKPVIAGMIGPFSLAGRLMDVTEIMYICYDEPEVVHTVLEKATGFLIRYGQALKAAGADAMMMAEPLAGILSPDMAGEFSVPYVKRIVEELQDDAFAVIYHNCGDSVASMPQLLFTQGAAAYHFGNSVDMERILQAAPADILCMGNVDPAGQITRGTPESVREATRSLLEKCGSYPNFVASSGCDIPAHAGWDNIQAFFGALKEW
jgi:uroporphyrinogen decarboxylase